MAIVVIQVRDNDDPVSSCAWSALRDIKDEEAIAGLLLIGYGG